FHGLDFLVAGKHNASLLSLRKGIWGPLSFSPYCESIKNAQLNQGRTGMILRFVAAGLAAALLASPIAFAGDETGRFVIAQADTDTSRYLSETRPLSSLSDKELKQRVRIGRQLMKGGSLAQDERKKVHAAMRAALQELKSRGSVGKSNAAAGEEGGAAAGE